MRAFVFTDTALTSRAGQFVWLELNVDDERNAAHRERLSLEALPTFYVVNPADESVVMRRVDGMSVPEMEAFLDEARAAAAGPVPSSPLEAALLRADRLNGEGKRPEAAAAYREALDQAPAGWPPYGRAVVALSFIHQMLGEDAKCLALAREALPRLSGSPASVMVARSGLDCALGLTKEDPGRGAAVAEMEGATRKTLAPPGVGAAADDVSTSYLSLIQARKDASDTPGAARDAEAWAAFLETQAGQAKTPEQRAVFDSHRLSAYLELKQPERAIPILQESEKDLPDDYNPPARLAVAYLETKRLDEALAASNRALPKVSGPRRVRVLLNRSDIFAARGDAAASREALEQALACAESLPAGQRSEGQIKALKKRLESPPAAPGAGPSVPDEARLRAMTARFAPVPIGADVSGLPPGERLALVKMIEAARVLDGLYLRQVWGGNEALLLELLADRSPLGQARLHAFLVNKGPWSQLDHQAPFLPGVPPKPEAAGFYPAGATKAEVETWMKGLPDAERVAAASFFATVRRAPDGRLLAVPYSVEYQAELARAAELLREAAAATTQPTLRAFLEKRAAAFLTNDYHASDVAWMELDATLEPTIGPYETYDDGWFGYKAAFEAFITVRDEKETGKLARFSSELQWLEDRLPIDPAFRNPKLGGMAPIRVVDVVFASGQGNSGVQTAAFNLPNDERVVAEKGSKRVMLKNTQRAKFEKVLVPISRVALAPGDQPNVDFEAFFTHILMHELMHGLGPGNIRVSGRETTVRLELKDTYGALEEAKADISGLWALQQLVDKGVLDRSFERTMYTTFLASAFRSIRFGVGEAHGKGQVLQLNHLLDAGGVRVASDGTFSVDPAKAKPAVTALTRELMTIQAEGSYAKAKALLERLAVVRPETRRVLERLEGVPVDVEPRFVTAEALAGR